MKNQPLSEHLKRRSLLLLFFGFVATTSHAWADKPKPNIVIILADDLGWQDVKCYDIDEPSPAETPNIDAFAKRGVMFWQAYSPAPTCAPSRCAIMSGNHPARAQKTHVVGGAPPSARSSRTRMMDPWYSGRIPEDEMTLAKALGQDGYITGHVGKWHMAIDHHAFPQPKDVGFDFTRSTRGAHSRMKDRLSGFATDAADDPFHLDADGFPYHQNNEDALTFLRENKDKPFFLYYATWLVHSPIMTRSKALLDKYVAKLGVDPSQPNPTTIPGQLNPFYFAMVEMLDHYVGGVFDYLDNTEDPRWPGHKLSENTYVIFTSDNGGMEGGSTERYTDNNPLDRGKISAKEGGTRVPLIIVGPGIAADVQTDVIASGLDFYPTVLSLTGTSTPEGKHLDGCDLSPLLLNDPNNAALVKDSDGDVRDTMVWHFPHGSALESTIRIGDFKLIRNYDHVLNDQTPELELFQLYDTKDGKQNRVDIEEAKNLALSMPERTASMNRELTRRLTEMKASYPSYNPNCIDKLPGKEAVCDVLTHNKRGRNVEFTYRENGAKIQQAYLLYTLNGGERNEEWFRQEAIMLPGSKVSSELPEGTTHYLINLIDENNFLRSYPEIDRKGKSSASALSANSDAAASLTNPTTTPPKKRHFSLAEKDADQDGKVSKAEYTEHFMSGFDRKDKNSDGVLGPTEHDHPSFARADLDKNDQLTREEFQSIFERQFTGLDKDSSGFISADEAK